ncbi:hypothetical protein PENTCL1PPCAC_26899 [Pristionchus entomophagus]|uniref:Uncharacterized protein n=1 Tax=Pristionchus entomophagus TaxID=358040 RepID=A0AAV5UF63_9BILA|nr:hypothetical protein PENTCL1PPCAC_26899 [Pristionchus entomophagus]
MMHGIITFFLLFISSSSSIDPICSSHCDITHDNDDSCFRSTIAFFDNSLVESLRNYVDVQTRLQRIRSFYGEPQLTTEEMVDRSINNMEKAPFRILEDEVFDLDGARVVLTELANKVQTIESDVSLPPLDCPQGCEKSSTVSIHLLLCQQLQKLWVGLFLASLALNMVILAIAVAAILYITSRNEKKARLLLKKSLEREKKKLNEKGRQPIVRENSDDERESSLGTTLDPMKWKKKEEKKGREIERQSPSGTVNDAYEGEF